MKQMSYGSNGVSRLLTGKDSSKNLGGQATLSLVFLVGGIVVFIALTLAFLAISFINSGIGFQSAQRALAIASAGAQDALIQLARNKNFANGSGYCVPTPCTGASATVTVVQNTPVANQATITSAATASIYSRKVQVVVSISPDLGQVNVVSWKTVAL